MKKRFYVYLTLPVNIEVIGEDKQGEINITQILNIDLPDISLVNDSLTDDSIKAIDEAFADALTDY